MIIERVALLLLAQKAMPFRPQIVKNSKKRRRKLGMPPKLSAIAPIKKTILPPIVLKNQKTSYSLRDLYIKDYKYRN